MSSLFKEGDFPYVVGAKGADQDAPELSNVHPYNAFVLDVFILGHMYEMSFLQVYHGLDFLEPLVVAMTQEQPERRPTAEAALRMFNEIRRNISRSQLPWRLRKRDESGTERVVYDTLPVAKVRLKLVRRGFLGTWRHLNCLRRRDILRFVLFAFSPALFTPHTSRSLSCTSYHPTASEIVEIVFYRQIRFTHGYFEQWSVGRCLLISSPPSDSQTSLSTLCRASDRR